ncbi:MAG: hypothetical protein GY870_20605, partial [archaeon]|nr:hypothetical protein [archaeon]
MRTKFNLKFISLLVFFCLLFSIQTSSVSAAIPENVDILFIGKTYDRWQDNPVRAALSLDSTFNVNETSIIAETESDIAGISSGTSTVAIIQDYIISNSSINSLKTWVEAGNSLIIFMGTRLTQNTSIFQELGIFSHSEVTEISPGIDSATFEENKTSPITSSIYWNSVPSCKNYTVFPITSNISNNIMMQKLPQQSTSLKHVKDPLIFNYSLGTGNVVIFSMWVEEEQSIDFAKSSYFN